jgi:SAM-dependent methyltransferase
VEDKINEIWHALKAKASVEELAFLKKCFRAYSSKGHLANIKTDLQFMYRMSPPPQRVLDFGCGIGLQSYLLAHAGYKVYGLETIEDKSLEGFLKGKAETHIKSRDESIKNVWDVIRIRQKAEFRFYDGVVIPHQDGFFDAVVAYAVIEHIPPVEVGGIMNEINRVLRRGGLFYIFQLPQRGSYTEFIARNLGLESHEYLWNPSEIRSALELGGFDVLKCEKADMVINHPYRVVNPVYGLLKILNRFLIHTPLSYFAHHLTAVAQKPST